MRRGEGEGREGIKQMYQALTRLKLSRHIRTLTRLLS